MNHKQKVKLARKMLSKKEIKNGVSVFQGEAWLIRKRQRLNSELKRVK